MASFHALGYEADSIADETLPYATVRPYEDEIRSVEGAEWRLQRTRSRDRRSPGGLERESLLEVGW